VSEKVTKFESSIKEKPSTRARANRRMSWILLIPVLVFFALMNILPTIWMLGLSFYNYTLTSANGATFTGFSNYLDFVKNWF